MNILIIDEKKTSLKNTVKELEIALELLKTENENVKSGLESEHDIHAFSDGQEAIVFAEEYRTAEQEQNLDVAFVEIELQDGNGLELAKRLQELYPKINLVFISGQTQHMGQAFEMHASGYCLRPVTSEKLLSELQNLRETSHDPAVEISHDDQLLTVQAFGNFEVYYAGAPVHFRYVKSKELLAYLIDRNGALCSNRELMCVLWEDTAEEHISYFKKVKTELISALKTLGCEDVLIQQRGYIGVVPANIKCDYFDFLAGKSEREKTYRGEYMSQYSWSEYTHGLLEN